MREKAKITVVLINYQRPANIPLIVDSIYSQNIPVNLFIWNNSQIPLQKIKADWVVNSSKNQFCWPRWYLASYAATPYVLLMDDDLCFTSPDALEKLIQFKCSHKITQDQLIGIEGVVSNELAPYFPAHGGKIYDSDHANKDQDCFHIKMPQKSINVDIVKGRLIFCHKNAIEKLNISPHFRDKCDDITVSGILSRKRKQFHILTPDLNEAIVDLPGKNDWMALSKSSDWADIRNKAKYYYF